MPTMTITRDENPVLFDALTLPEPLPDDALELIRLLGLERRLMAMQSDDPNLRQDVTRVRELAVDACNVVSRALKVRRGKG